MNTFYYKFDELKNEKTDMKPNILDAQFLRRIVNKIRLVVDLLLDETDLDRLSNTKPGYLYLKDSNSLYLKHINHFDYHPPNVAISYGKEHHQLMNLENGRKQKFLINHQELDEFYSVAMGVTDHLAMLALGDSYHTRIQIVDAGQAVKVHLNETYEEEDSKFFPVPRYFTGNTEQTILVYSDNSKLEIDLKEFQIGTRQLPEVDQIVRGKTILDERLSIFGPFMILEITPNMKPKDLVHYKLLIEKSKEANWVAVDDNTLVNTELVDVSDFDDLIIKREKQVDKMLEIIDNTEKGKE